MNKTSRKGILLALILTLIGLAMVISTTYAWLGVSRVPFVSDLSLYVVTENGLYLASDEEGEPGTWTTYLDVSELLKDMVPLKPATYTASTGFQKIVYNSTGRTNYVEPMEVINFNQKYVDGDKDSEESKLAEENGYMIAITIWLKSEGKTATIRLTDPVERVDGQMGAGTYVVGEPEWDQESVSHINGGHGSETTIRFGFESTPMKYQTNAETGETELVSAGDPVFVIYEPNADIHADGTEGYIETESVEGGPLVDNDHLVIQKASSWDEQTPVYEGTVIYSTGDFIQNPALCTVNGDGLTKMVIYMWMEGQDVDCIARAVDKEVTLLANIQFGPETEEDGGGGIHRYDEGD